MVIVWSWLVYDVHTTGLECVNILHEGYQWWADIGICQLKICLMGEYRPGSLAICIQYLLVLNKPLQLFCDCKEWGSESDLYQLYKHAYQLNHHTTWA